MSIQFDQGKSICGFDADTLNNLLECCFDPSHLIPEGPAVSDMAQVEKKENEIDTKLWDFDPSSCLQLCQENHSYLQTETATEDKSSYTGDSELDCCSDSVISPCCNNENGKCDHGNQIGHFLCIDDFLACGIETTSPVASTSELIKNNYLSNSVIDLLNFKVSPSTHLNNTSDLRESLKENTEAHHHHLLHLHHHNPDDNETHTHDIVFHHKDHHGLGPGHHHHLKLPDQVNGDNFKDFILPKCHTSHDDITTENFNIRLDDSHHGHNHGHGHIHIHNHNHNHNHSQKHNHENETENENEHLGEKPHNHPYTILPSQKERKRRCLKKLSLSQLHLNHKGFHCNINEPSHAGDAHNLLTNVKIKQSNSGISTPDNSHIFNNPIKSENSSDDERPTICKWDDCNKKFSGNELSRHIYENHFIDLPIKPELAPLVKNFNCEWSDCVFSADDMDKLLEHIPEHTENNKPIQSDKFICKWIHLETGKKCEREFKNTEELTNHLVTAHVESGKSTYNCNWENCDRRHKHFTQRQKIIRHLNTHTGHKPFMCKICGKQFSLDLMLKQHMRIHTGEKPYECDQCSKTFTTSSSLTIHKRTHTGAKPMQCKICGKRFSESSNLNKHMKIHSRKYKCDLCLKSFDVEIKYNRHLANCQKKAKQLF